MKLWDRLSASLDEHMKQRELNKHVTRLRVQKPADHLSINEKETALRTHNKLQQLIRENLTESKGAEGSMRDVTNALSGVENQLLRLQAMVLDRDEQIENLLSRRKQEDWADAREKRRMLFFRIGTTMIVASGFLFTYWIAGPDYLNIRLPMMPPIR